MRVHFVRVQIRGIRVSEGLHSHLYPYLSLSRADSVSWNPHKSLHVPLQCSAFLTRHEGLLKKSNSTGATYLFQQDKLSYSASYDTGDKSFQCGRLNDAFKFWLMWKQRVRNLGTTSDTLGLTIFCP